MTNEKFMKLIEEDFGVYNGNSTIELETWTDGGVNMFVNIQKDSKKSYLEQFKEYVNSINIDEEIEMHRQEQLYRDNFTIRESLEDFESYKENLNSIIEKLEYNQL